MTTAIVGGDSVYPTWMSVSPTLWRSVEEWDGAADFTIRKTGRNEWVLASRTSLHEARFTGRYAVRNAMRSVRTWTA